MQNKAQSPYLAIVRALRGSREKTLSVSFLASRLQLSVQLTQDIVDRLVEFELVSQNGEDVTLIKA